MAAHETHVPVLLIGIVLLGPFSALVSAESSREKIKIGLLHLNPEKTGTNGEQSLQARGLFDSFGSLFNTAAWITPPRLSNAKREVAEEEDRWEEEHEHDDHDDEHDYDEHVAEVTKGKGTSNSLNNFGTGKQNFRGATINTGGHTDSFNHDGDGEQDFSGAAIDSVGFVNVGNKHNNGEIQRNGGIRIGSIGSGGISIGNIGSDGISVNGGHIVMTGNVINGRISNVVIGNNYIQIDSNGVIVHVIDSGNHGLNMINNKIYIGGQMICSTKTKSFAKPTYQKTPEGARWYTNVKVGTPMTPAEIAQFEKDWAKILKEQEETKKRLEKEAEERARKHKEWERQHKAQMDALDAQLARDEEERERQQKERDRQHKEQMDALDAQLARDEKERERQQKERDRQHKKQMDALDAQLAREEKERERQQKERERQQKERMDALQARLKRDAEARARQQEERTRQQQARAAERERQQRERMSWRQQREARRTPSWNRGDSFSWW